MSKVTEKIDEIRKQKGWTVNRLATEAMLTQSTVANMFATGSDPKLSTLAAICEAYGITLAQFFADGDDEIDPITMETALMISKLDNDEKKAVYDLVKVMKRKRT